MKTEKENNEVAPNELSGSNSPDLMKLVKIINEMHSEIQNLMSSALDKAIHLGGELIEIKEKTKDGEHGKWTKWVEDNLEFSIDTAQNYMKLYRNKEMLEKAKTETDRFFGIAKALRLIKEQKEEAKATKKVEVEPTENTKEVKSKKSDRISERTSNLEGYFKDVSDYDSLIKDTCQFLDEMITLDISEDLKNTIKKVLSNLSKCEETSSQQ